MASVLRFEIFRWTIPEIKSCNCNSALLYEPQLGKNWPSKKQFCYRFSSSNFRKDLPFCHHSFVEVRQELNPIKNWTWLKRPEKDKKHKGWVHFPFFLCLLCINKKTIWSWKKKYQKICSSCSCNGIQTFIMHEWFTKLQCGKKYIFQQLKVAQ